MRYGYIRVSSATQNPERQIRKMGELGVSPSRMFVDYASGKNLDRPRYSELMGVIERGDTILLDSIDRLGRNYELVTREWRRITEEVGCDIRCLDLEWFDSARFREMGAIGICVEDMLLSLLAYVAQTEREKNRQRQAEGIAIAKQQGKYTGRKPTEYPPEVIAEAQAALAKSKAAAARVLGCHVNTVYRMIEDGRLKVDAA